MYDQVVYSASCRLHDHVDILIGQAVFSVFSRLGCVDILLWSGILVAQGCLLLVKHHQESLSDSGAPCSGGFSVMVLAFPAPLLQCIHFFFPK